MLLKLQKASAGSSVWPVCLKTVASHLRQSFLYRRTASKSVQLQTRASPATVGRPLGTLCFCSTSKSPTSCWHQGLDPWDLENDTESPYYMPPYFNFPVSHADDPDTHPHVVRCEHMVPMRDGVRLAVTVYRPSFGEGIPVPDPLPVVFHRTPYNKEKSARTERALLPDGTLSEPIDNPHTAERFARRGYVVVMQDCRGRYQSEGRFTKYVNEGNDGVDSLAWITSQPWCNGKVGCFGLSYCAHVQLSLACKQPPGLAAMFLESGGFWDAYTDGVRYGGAFTMKQVTWAFKNAKVSPEVSSDPAVKTQMEALDIHDWFRRIHEWFPGYSPLSLAPDYESYIFHDWEAQYYDEEWARVGLSVASHLHEISDVPTLIICSWYDPYIGAMTNLFSGLRSTKHSVVRMVLGPWTHGDHALTYAGELDFGPQCTFDRNIAPTFQAARAAWFDEFLHGRPPGASPSVGTSPLPGGSPITGRSPVIGASPQVNPASPLIISGTSTPTTSYSNSQLASQLSHPIPASLLTDAIQSRASGGQLPSVIEPIATVVGFDVVSDKQQVAADGLGGHRDSLTQPTTPTGMDSHLAGGGASGAAQTALDKPRRGSLDAQQRRALSFFRPSLEVHDSVTSAAIGITTGAGFIGSGPAACPSILQRTGSASAYQPPIIPPIRQTSSRILPSSVGNPEASILAGIIPPAGVGVTTTLAMADGIKPPVMIKSSTRTNASSMSNPTVFGTSPGMPPYSQLPLGVSPVDRLDVLAAMQSRRSGAGLLGTSPRVSGSNVTPFASHTSNMIMYDIESSAGSTVSEFWRKPLPPVKYFRMGGGTGCKNTAGRLDHGGMWLTSTDWPPPWARKMAVFRLTPDGLLQEEVMDDDTPGGHFGIAEESADQDAECETSDVTPVSSPTSSATRSPTTRWSDGDLQSYGNSTPDLNAPATITGGDGAHSTHTFPTNMANSNSSPARPITSDAPTPTRHSRKNSSLRDSRSHLPNLEPRLSQGFGSEINLRASEGNTLSRAQSMGGLPRTQSWLGGQDSVVSAKSMSSKHSVLLPHHPLHPVPTIGGNITSGEPIMSGGAFDQVERPQFFGCSKDHTGRRLCDHPGMVSWATPWLECDLEVTGIVRVTLAISSDTPDADLHVTLVDEYPPSRDYPQGFSMNVASGIARARFRHGWLQSQVAWLQPDNIANIMVELNVASNLFVKGHRLRLDIAASCFPRYDINYGVTDEELGKWKLAHGLPHTPVETAATQQDESDIAAKEYTSKQSQSSMLESVIESDVIVSSGCESDLGDDYAPLLYAPLSDDARLALARSKAAAIAKGKGMNSDVESIDAMAQKLVDTVYGRPYRISSHVVHMGPEAVSYVELPVRKCEGDEAYEGAQGNPRHGHTPGPLIPFSPKWLQRRPTWSR